MSVAVSLEHLREESSRYGSPAFLLTVNADGRPHSVALTASWSGDDLVMAPGNSSISNARSRPLVSLLWPPFEPGGYSLIVDAVVASASSGDEPNSLTLHPTKAVLHRPAAASDPDGGDCGSDCVPLYKSAG